MENPKVKTRKAFIYAMEDMIEVLSLNTQNIWKGKLDSLDMWYQVGSSYLYTKEQRHLNKSLGLTKTKELNKWYKS
jgi:hypothetical protein